MPAAKYLGVVECEMYISFSYNLIMIISTEENKYIFRLSKI